jgi:hypothetical protein
MSIKITHDLLSLVMDKPPSARAMKKWSIKQMQAAEKWAATEYVHANDHNEVRRLPMPSFLGTIHS